MKLPCSSQPSRSATLNLRLKYRAGGGRWIRQKLSSRQLGDRQADSDFPATVNRGTVNSNSTLKVERPEGYTGKHLAQFKCLAINLAIYPDSSPCTKNRILDCFYSLPVTKNIKRTNFKPHTRTCTGKTEKAIYISGVKNTNQEKWDVNNTWLLYSTYLWNSLNIFANFWKI